VTESVLTAHNLRVNRDDEPVLKDISLTVGPSDRVLVQGHSGVGKTTLFLILGLLELPDSGTLEINGHDTSQLTEHQRAGLRRTALGFVYQDFRLVTDLTARENAALPQDHTGDRDEAWLDDLFNRLDIADVADRRPSSLSGGEKQRVATARALANRPDIVLADEPTGQLDPETADRLLELLCSLQNEFGTALIVVSHDRSIVERFHRVYRLQQEKLIPVVDIGE